MQQHYSSLPRVLNKTNAEDPNTQCCRQQAVSAIKASSVQLRALKPSYQSWCKGRTTDIKIAPRSSKTILNTRKPGSRYALRESLHQELLLCWHECLGQVEYANNTDPQTPIIYNGMLSLALDCHVRILEHFPEM